MDGDEIRSASSDEPLLQNLGCVESIAFGFRYLEYSLYKPKTL